MDGNIREAHAGFFVEPEQRTNKSDVETVGVIGLGYVGLPVSLALSKVYETVVGFDINAERIAALRNAEDSTGEVEETELFHSPLILTNNSRDLAQCTFYIVAVPTPADDAGQPDLSLLRKACHTIAPLLNAGDLVVFESTVYPGATEEVCAPELEHYSGLVAGRDFYLGYSPERITPGDREHGLRDVPKIVSADTPDALSRITDLYSRIIPAGIHQAPSIKVAEAAKVFENTQRDVNIALMNEFSVICAGLGIQTRDVVNATATKWNALPFTPGLVGGHCIGVDPLYLAHKAQTQGNHPEIILASRRRNDAMAALIAQKALQFLSQRSIDSASARVGVFGLTFKENVPDARNSKVVDLVDFLTAFHIEPLLCDPLIDPNFSRDTGLVLQDDKTIADLDILILAVPHDVFLPGQMLQHKIRPGGTLMDIRSACEPSMLRRDITYWSL